MPATLYYLFGVFFSITKQDWEGFRIIGAATATLLITAGLLIFLGYGVTRLKTWARYCVLLLCMIFEVIGILNYSLIYGPQKGTIGDTIVLNIIPAMVIIIFLVPISSWNKGD